MNCQEYHRCKVLLSPVAIAVIAVFTMPLIVAAMEIWKFDKMTGPDQDEYILILVQGSQKFLKDAGRPDDAAKIHKLFTTNAENGISIGMNKFMMYLALVRKTDADRLIENPGATRLEAEHVMYIMLKHEDIVLPKNFMTVGKDFKPKHPPKEEKK